MQKICIYVHEFIYTYVVRTSTFILCAYYIFNQKIRETSCEEVLFVGVHAPSGRVTTMYLNKKSQSSHLCFLLLFGDFIFFILVKVVNLFGTYDEGKMMTNYWNNSRFFF